MLARLLVDNGLGDIPARQSATNQKHSGYESCPFCLSTFRTSLGLFLPADRCFFCSFWQPCPSRNNKTKYPEHMEQPLRTQEQIVLAGQWAELKGYEVC